MRWCNISQYILAVLAGCSAFGSVFEPTSRWDQGDESTPTCYC